MGWGIEGHKAYFRKDGQRKPLWGDINQSEGINWIFGEIVFSVREDSI